MPIITVNTTVPVAIMIDTDEQTVLAVAVLDEDIAHDLPSADIRDGINAQPVALNSNQRHDAEQAWSHSFWPAWEFGY